MTANNRNQMIAACFSFAAVCCVIMTLLDWRHNNLNGQEVNSVTQATAPDDILAKRIQNLKDGEFGYVMPEALVVDLEKKVWINKNFSLSDLDTQIKLKVDKLGLHVEISNPGIKWLPVELEDVSPNHKRIFLPVASIQIFMPPVPEANDPRPKVKPAVPKENTQ